MNTGAASGTTRENFGGCSRLNFGDAPSLTGGRRCDSREPSAWDLIDWPKPPQWRFIDAYTSFCAGCAGGYQPVEKPPESEGRTEAMSSILNSHSAVAPGVQGLSANLCLAMAKVFLDGPLKRFGFRKKEITRFDSMENYVADRVEQIDDYARLFR